MRRKIEAELLRPLAGQAGFREAFGLDMDAWWISAAAGKGMTELQIGLEWQI